jgi:hypothetical protein
MNCEYCNRTLRPGDMVHGIKHGSVPEFKGEFVPARDAAYTVLCSLCSQRLYRLIYSELNTTINPTLYRTLTRYT